MVNSPIVTMVKTQQRPTLPGGKGSLMRKFCVQKSCKRTASTESAPRPSPMQSADFLGVW